MAKKANTSTSNLVVSKEVRDQIIAALSKFKHYDMHGVTCYEVTVTPELATLLLEANVNNRGAKELWIDFLSENITQGEWVMTGDPIKFDTNWVLIDKQHTLYAVLKSNKPIKTIVMTGFDPKTFTVLDRNLQRTLLQTFEREGVSISSKYSSFLKLADLMNKDKITTLQQSKYKYTENFSTVYKLYQDDPDVRRTIRTMERLKEAETLSGCVFSMSAMAAAHWLMSKDNKKLADHYIQKIYSGNGIVQGDIFMTVRNRMLAARNKSKRTNILQQLSVLIEGWNAWVSGKQLKRLRIPEEMPSLTSASRNFVQQINSIAA